MTTNVLNSALPKDFNRRTFLLYIAILTAVLISGLGILLYKGKLLFLGSIIGLPILALVLTQPKIAVGQYIFFLFVSRTVIESIPLTITDISGLLIIGAGTIDFLLNGSDSEKPPRLAYNYLFLVLALAFSGLFAYDHNLAVRAVLRVTLLAAVFLSLCRLLKRTGIEYPLKFFFWLCVLNSVLVIFPFVLSGGTYRAFGFAAKFFDDLSMLTFPLGIALNLWSDKGNGGKYLLGSLLVFGALVATQSRAPLLISIVVTVLVFIIGLNRYLKEKSSWSPESDNRHRPIPGSVVKREIITISLVVIGVAIAVMSAPTLFEVIQTRFTDIFSVSSSSAVWKRLLLWNNAFTAFLDHPLVGVGPGNYKVIHTIYPAIHLEFIHFFVRGLNAHNLVLHYLAETGLVGTIPMILLVFNQFRLSRKTWLLSQGLKDLQISAALFAVGLTLLLTTFIEADWMWGFAGYTFVFFVALISSNFAKSVNAH